MNTQFPPPNQCPVRYQAHRIPEHLALNLDGRAISYRQLDGWLTKTQRTLRALGVETGQHLVVIADSPLGAILLAMVCLRDGVVFCPVNPAFPDQQREAYGKRINAVRVVHAGKFTTGLDEIKAVKTADIEINSQAMMDLIATSGTSGLPKAVAHCYQNHYASAVGSHTLTPLYKHDSWLLSLPMFHVGGFAIAIRCFIAGATIVIDSNRRPLEDVLKTEKVTHLSLVNTQLYRLVKQGMDFYGAGVKHILLGGGIASPSLVDQVLQQGVSLQTTYGMTEMASQVCTGKPVFTESGVTSGEILVGRALRISESGEILVRGETLSSGYYDQGQVLSITDDEGWYHTGDTGRWYQGQLQVIGRMDNQFISGGENIYPEEIEQALLSLPEVIQAVVVAEDHDEYGKRPIAYVQLDSAGFDEPFTKKCLQGKIARFKVPDKIRPFPDHLVSTGIKVNRHFFQQLVTSRSLKRDE